MGKAGVAATPDLSAPRRRGGLQSWKLGILVLVGILGLPTVGLAATDHLFRQDDLRQAQASNAQAATAVAYEVSQSFRQRLAVFQDFADRTSLALGLSDGNRSLLHQSLGVVLKDGQYCRVVLRSPGLAPIVVTAGRCWSPAAPARGQSGLHTLGPTIVGGAAFSGWTESGVLPGHPRASIEAVFAVRSLTSATVPGDGVHTTLVKGTRIVSSSVAAIVGKRIAVPVSVAMIRAGRPGNATIYAGLIHTEVIEAYRPVPGTGLGVFFSVTTQVAYAAANHAWRVLLAGYLVLLAIGFGLAGGVFLTLRRRDRAREADRVRLADLVQAAYVSQQALRESEERFQMAFEHAPIGMSLIGLDGRYQRVNPAMGHITEYSEAQLQQLTVADTTHPEDLAADVAAMDKLLAGEVATYTLEKRLLTATGPEIWVSKSASLVRHEDGSPRHFIAQIQNITERKKHEEALGVERRRLRAAQSIGHIGSWEMELATGEITWSDTLLALYGLGPTTATEDLPSVLTRIHPDDRGSVHSALEECERTGEPMFVRHRMIRADDGRLRWLDARGEAVYEQGTLVRLAGTVMDVSEQVLAAKEAKEGRDLAVEASRQKSAFLATMSHEIRTPMNAVIGMTELLLDTPLNTEQCEFVETVRRSGDSLLSIINDILDFSKIEAGGLELEEQPFDLHACVENALDMVAATSHAKGLELAGQVDARCPNYVIGDVTRLRQVLVNLLSNAVKFTAQGEVILSVEPGPQPNGEASLLFAVTDTGIGIPVDAVAKLFESFSQVDASTTRNYGGTGLGLAISKRLVEAMGGVLAVDSAAGAGSTFSFTVTLAPVTPDPGSPTFAPIPPRATMRVLLAEDNPVNQRLGKLMLTKLGHHVDVVGNGREAAEAVHLVGYDAVLMDVEMPEMDGLEATRLIRGDITAPRQPQIVAMTASALLEDRQACIEAGMDDYLAKPVRLQDLDTALVKAAAASPV